MYRIGHLEVESPFGNAGGVVKTPEEVELMAHTGVGWIEAGSYTLEERAGNGPNGERVWFYNPDTGEMGNSLGMPGQGMDVAEQQTPDMVEISHKHGKAFVMNVAPVSDEPVAETRELVDRATVAGADAVLLNAGCPNVVTEGGGRHEILSHNVAALDMVLTGLRGIVEKYDKKVFIRVSPTDKKEQALQIMSVIRSSGVVGAVFTPNTWPGFKPKENGEYALEVPGNAGGRSGPATAKKSRKQTKWALKGLECSGIDVVSSSGITTGDELHSRMEAGAAAGAGTTLFYTSAEEGWSEAVDRVLRQFAEASGS